MVLQKAEAQSVTIMMIDQPAGAARLIRMGEFCFIFCGGWVVSMVLDEPIGFAAEVCGVAPRTRSFVESVVVMNGFPGCNAFIRYVRSSVLGEADAITETPDFMAETLPGWLRS